MSAIEHAGGRSQEHGQRASAPGWRKLARSCGSSERKRARRRLIGATVAMSFLGSVLTACSEEPLLELSVTGGDADRGRAALAKYECGVCHVIPDIPGAAGQVGPPLTAFARHVYIAGKFPNVPEVLVRWIPDAPSMAPSTGMPAIAMSEREARDMAAFLYTLK